MARSGRPPPLALLLLAPLLLVVIASLLLPLSLTAPRASSFAPSANKHRVTTASQPEVRRNLDHTSASAEKHGHGSAVHARDYMTREKSPPLELIDGEAVGKKSLSTLVTGHLMGGCRRRRGLLSLTPGESRGRHRHIWQLPLRQDEN